MDRAATHQHETASWSNEAFVTNWLEMEKTRVASRRRQFSLIRAAIPKRSADEFRYLNLGAGPGYLDEVLLDHFEGANATLVDSSLLMLDAARDRLARFGSRVEYVQANLARPEWAGAVGEGSDLIISTIAVHYLRDAVRIRALYGELYRLLGHGGMFLNLDYVRPARPSLAPLGPWAAMDPDAGLTAHGHGDELPGTLLEQLGWLAEAGFPNVDVLWKEFDLALVCGIRDHLHMPDGGHGHGESHGHSH